MDAMDHERTKLLWTCVAAVAAVVAALATVGILVWGMATHFDVFGTKDAELKPVDENVTPTAAGRAAYVTFENLGQREGAIVRVRLHGGEWIKTPSRRPWAGAAAPVYVEFNPEFHYNERKKEFQLTFEPPRTVPAGETVTLIVSIVEPEWVGLTYDGKLTVVYNSGRKGTVDDVQVDVLRDKQER